MAKYLVTGGAGFIGSSIVEELLKKGKYVRVLDNFSTGKRENIDGFIGKKNFELTEGDLRSYHSVREAVNGMDYVLHQGAFLSVSKSFKDPITTNDVNINGTLNILNAALDAGVKRVVYASSASIYGNSNELPKQEDMKPRPESPYALSKYAGERYCQIFAELYGLETVCLRYFNVFGLRQDANSRYSAVIPRFLKLVREGKRPTIYGDGEASRDFIYVSNVVSANLLACEAGEAGEIYNIASGKGVTINQLLEKLSDIINENIEPIYVDSRLGDVKHSYASIEKAKSYLNYQVKVGFDEGIVKVARYRE